MKAISPMIAAILLIAFVAAIGAILALCFPSIIQKITSPTQVVEWAFEVSKVDSVVGNEVLILALGLQKIIP